MELPGSSWTLVSFETDMEVTPALTEAPATLTFSVEGEQAGRQTQRLQPLLRELHPDRRPPPYWSAWIHPHDVQPPQMAQEDRFFQALAAAERCELSNGELLIIYTGTASGSC